MRKPGKTVKSVITRYARPRGLPENGLAPQVG